jgi:DinB superfamily
MSNDQIVRQELLDLLSGGEAHMSFEQAIADFPLEQINIPLPGCAYTPWHLLEHLRFCQWDILEYARNPAYVAAKFPDDYWPPRNTTTDAAGWAKTLADFRRDLAAFCDLLRDPTVDLYAAFPHAPQHNLFRCILVLADHNAYHLGEFAIQRQVASNWGKRLAGKNPYL